MSEMRKEELVAKDLQYKLDKGIIKIGQKLSERTIAKSYSISRGTARMALQRLEKEGLIDRKQAIGYFVNQPKQEPVLSFIDFILNKYDTSPITKYFSTFNVLHCRLTDTDKDLSEKLHVTLGTTIFYIAIQFATSSSDYYTICKIFIPTNENYESNKKIITNLLQKELSSAITVDVTLNLEFTDSSAARLLHLKEKSPLMHTSAIFRNKNEQACLLIEQYSDARHTVSIKPSSLIRRKWLLNE